MARRKLTVFSKLLITLLIVGGLFFGYTYLKNNGYLEGLTDNGGGTEKPKKPAKKDKNADVINIGVVTWGGYAGGQYFNEGFEANTDSRFYKDYGFQVEFKILDDFIASRKAFENDEVQLLWATVDAFPTESGSLAGDPQVVFQADWSRGGDAVVVRRGISKVSDLKGKKIAVAELTPSHSFLIWLLEAGGLTTNDVEIVTQPNAIDAASTFKAGQVDAAVVWSPDDQDCVDKVPGARVLESTRNASHIIADVFLAKKDWAIENRDVLQQLYEGWMIGASEINQSDAN
ncbi:MAG: ABC transporter substrate-binding protein, partial [Bacteroidota bacterium]